MGSCCSSEQEVAGQVVQQGRGATVVTGTNKKLKDFSIYEWSSDVPITAEQLQSDRNKYWETQPSYGGRVEVWQSLRLACESGQVSTAQAIIDSMNITVPTGKLTDGCYDELGAQYVIPIMYVWLI
jgi:Ubiquitin-binding domain